jgi:hypothetical protein
VDTLKIIQIIAKLAIISGVDNSLNFVDKKGINISNINHVNKGAAITMIMI